MDRDAAFSLLGLDVDAPPSVVRARYLALIKEHHPDVAAVSSAVDPADLTEAYRVARTAAAPTATPPVASGDRSTATGDTLSVPLPPDEAFLRLLDVAATVGSVTYVDPEGGLLEVLLELVDGGRCSVLASLQGRAAFGSTDVFLTVDGLPASAVERLAEELALLVDGSLNS